MSFGWSTGDIVSAIKLTNKIIICVSNVGGSREHFQELESELRALVRALDEISDLTKVPGQLPEITALKFAACLCEETLKRFFGRIKPFDKSLGGEAGKGESKLKAVPRMVRWELLVKKDVPEFRTYLVAHVGSLNMRLSTALLKLSATSREISNTNHLEQQKSTLAVRQQLTEQTRLVCQTITGIYQQDTIPKLDSLLDVASSVWRTQAELMEVFAKAVQALPPPDLNYTWAQAPIRFEDALGRVIPVPSEYDWDKLEAIIIAQFKEGPGHRKVRSGEYELFHGSRSIKPFGSRGYRRLPGMKITMTFVVGQYIGSERCPRVGCSSRLFVNDRGIPISVKICTECQGSFRISSTILPKPLKRLDQNADHLSTGLTSERQQHMLKWHHAEYDDRSTYKNISIYITELPPTPSKFRHKYHRSRELLQKNAQTSEQQSLAHTLNSQGPYVRQHQTISRNLRPQTEVYCPIPIATVSLRPATLSYEGGYSTSWRRQPHSLSLSRKLPLEKLMDEVGGALLDKGFSGELSAIEQYFRVLSEAQRTALLYALVQQTKASTLSDLILPVMREWLNISISAQGG